MYEQKGIEIIEAEACPDHIHMLISFPPKYSIAYVMGYLKGKSSLMIFDRHANLKYKYGNRHFWARGYFVDTVDKNKKRIEAHNKNQLKQDQIADQMSLKEFVVLTRLRVARIPRHKKRPLEGLATRKESSWQTHSWPLKGLC